MPELEVPALSLTLWTSDVALAVESDAAGVDRIGCDLERAGKRDRQDRWDTWLSDHVVEDVRKVRGVLRHARLFARSDPFDGSNRSQLDALLAEGVEVLMLPVAEDPEAIATAVGLTAGRATLVALVESRRGVDAIEEIADVPGLDEIFLGPNDLSASLGLEHRFAALVSDEAERIATAAHAAGRPFGVAGVAAVGDERIPIPPDLVYAQLARLGAGATLLSRVFLAAPGRLDDKVRDLRRRYAEVQQWSPAALEAARAELADRARGLGRL